MALATRPSSDVRASGSRSSVTSSSAAIMPQPMSTPTAAGMTALGGRVLGAVARGGDHAAADADAACCGDARAGGGDPRAGGGADAGGGVGHERDVPRHDREPRRLLGLADGARVDVARPGDELVV